MMERIAEASPCFKAKITGVSCLHLDFGSFYSIFRRNRTGAPRVKLIKELS